MSAPNRRREYTVRAPLDVFDGIRLLMYDCAFYLAVVFCSAAAVLERVTFLCPVFLAAA